jgi:hypothetical protein
VSDELAVDVYETHGRVALETGDGAEFRQCLAVLRRLYARGLPGNTAEFAAYGVLAAAGHGHRILAHELARVEPALLAEEPVAHALEAARAARCAGGARGRRGGRGARTPGPLLCAGTTPAAHRPRSRAHRPGPLAAPPSLRPFSLPHRSGAYLRFMQLYATAPRMGPYLMDALLERVRLRGLRTLASAYSPLPLPLDWVAAQLGFEGAEEAAEWAAARGAAVDGAGGQLLTRESKGAITAAPAGGG